MKEFSHLFWLTDQSCSLKLEIVCLCTKVYFTICWLQYVYIHFCIKVVYQDNGWSCQPCPDIFFFSRRLAFSRKHYKWLMSRWNTFKSGGRRRHPLLQLASWSQRRYKTRSSSIVFMALEDQSNCHSWSRVEVNFF